MAKATQKKATPAAKGNVRPPATGASKTAQAASAQGRPAPTPARVPAQPAQRQQQQRQQVATRPANQVVDPASVANLPEFMRPDADIGKGAILTQDLEVPRLKLIQGTSKELNDYNDLRPGHFFHTTAEEIFDEPFKAVPIFVTRTYLLWRPLEDGGGILARADDGIHWSPGEGEFSVKLDRKDGGKEVTWHLAPTVQQSGLANWGTLNPEDKNSPPAATLMYNYLLAFPDHPELMPAVYTFQRSGIKAGRSFNTKIKTMRTPLFGSMFEFRAVEQQNKANQTFFNVSVLSAGVVQDEDAYMQFRALHEQFSNTGLNIRDLQSLQAEGENDGQHDADGGDAAGTPGF